MGFFGGGGAAPANMGGATSSVAGTSGLVPAPSAGSQKAALSGAGIFSPYLYKPKILSGSGQLYAVLGANSRTNTIYAFGTNKTFFSPIILPEGTVTALGITFFSQANGNIRIGLYDSATDDLPTNLITSGSASKSTGAAANALVTISGLSSAIKAGLYYCAFHQSGGNSVNHITQGEATAWIHGNFSNGHNSGYFYQIDNAGYNSGAFPNPRTGTLTMFAGLYPLILVTM